MEITYKGYTTALTMKNTKLKGLFKYFLTTTIFVFIYISLFRGNNSDFLILALYSSSSIQYTIYDSFTNRPNITSILPLSDKKRLLYSYIYTIQGLATLIIVLTLIFGLICFWGLIFELNGENISMTFPDNGKLLSMGKLLPLIMVLGIYLTMPVLAFIRNKKLWYCIAGIIYALNIAWGLFLCSYGENKFKATIDIEEKFAHMPHHEIIFIIFCIFTVLEIAAGAFLAYKMITKRSE